MDKAKYSATKSCVNIITILFTDCKREQVDFTQPLPNLFGQSAKFWQRILQDKKVFENFEIGVDKTNRLWYSVLATRLDEPNRFAELRCTRKAEAAARAAVKNRICHGRAAELCLVIPKFVVARPLHLAHARPLCGLKAPLGLSLLRKRQFLHSILFFQVSCGFCLLPRLDARHGV